MIDRYTLSKMGNVWSDQRRMDIMLNVEILACESMTKLGLIPKSAMEKIRKKAKYDLEEVKKIEEKTKHDVVALIVNVGAFDLFPPHVNARMIVRTRLWRLRDQAAAIPGRSGASSIPWMCWKERGLPRR